MSELFDAFLTKKKVNIIDFKLKRPDDYARLGQEFELMGEKSFDQRKKFLINDWRLEFPIVLT